MLSKVAITVLLILSATLLKLSIFFSSNYGWGWNHKFVSRFDIALDIIGWVPEYVYLKFEKLL